VRQSGARAFAPNGAELTFSIVHCPFSIELHTMPQSKWKLRNGQWKMENALFTSVWTDALKTG